VFVCGSRKGLGCLKPVGRIQKTLKGRERKVRLGEDGQQSLMEGTTFHFPGRKGLMGTSGGTHGT
jgi:hypothetical protein